MTFSGDQMFKKDKDPAMLWSFKNAVFLDTNEFFGERANATKIALKSQKIISLFWKECSFSFLQTFLKNW